MDGEVIHIPGIMGELGMVPISVAVDKVHVLLGLDRVAADAGDWDLDAAGGRQERLYVVQIFFFEGDIKVSILIPMNIYSIFQFT